MTPKKTYEELVELLQEGRIGHLQFIQESGNAQDYREWCRSHGTEECDESAEFYIEQTEAEMMDRQVMDNEDYGIWL
jgi:hypothetical protein